MLPPRTSCGAPTELSPQKAEAHPILTASFLMASSLKRSFPRPHRGALFGEGLHAFARVFGKSQQTDLAFGKSRSFFERHSFHLLQSVEPSPNCGGRILKDRAQNFLDSFIERIGNQVDKSDGEGGRGVDRLAGDAHLGQSPARDQMLQDAERLHRKQTDLYFWETEFRMTIRYCQVTHGEQAYAAGHARAIHARDHGDDAGASAAEQSCIPDVRLAAIECERAAAFEISTGAQSVIAGSGENDRT